MREPLFVCRNFTMHSGGISSYKIECDALTDEDIETLAYIIVQKLKEMTGKETSGIGQVVGVPQGGLRLAAALQKHVNKRGPLKVIVDDVLTTGQSMERERERTGWGETAVGVVIFARGRCPDWIKPIFSMQFFNTKDVF